MIFSYWLSSEIKLGNVDIYCEGGPAGLLAVHVRDGGDNLELVDSRHDQLLSGVDDSLVPNLLNPEGGGLGRETVRERTSERPRHDVWREKWHQAPKVAIGGNSKREGDGVAAHRFRCAVAWAGTGLDAEAGRKDSKNEGQF